MAHIEKRHAGGALWRDGDLSVWQENTEDGKYIAICDRHGMCTNSNNRAWCKSLKVEDFCEVCSGSSQWCNTCEADERPYGTCAEHDVIDDSVMARNSANR